MISVIRVRGLGLGTRLNYCVTIGLNKIHLWPLCLLHKCQHWCLDLCLSLTLIILPNDELTGDVREVVTEFLYIYQVPTVC